ncbi:RNA polymerase II-associated protein 3 [Camellia lanceoleosa]|uniref:RNA polymerase II-associated protein 3 n=1 Tax=Camellia lanceoleosa TaxID=1840588 RepID=A0ACC0IMM8_9ERIC|nr:RNA polymerase II-associated protein 3 [Camellia lanceoleosa]
MARASSKHDRDQALDFQGFLNDLQDWEMSLNDKDKKLKSRGLDKEKLETRVVDEDRKPMAKAPMSDNSSNARQYDYSRNYDSITHLSGDFMKEESSPDATSEKESKFKEAVICYSRSIALSPTAVAYANRAMAYLKMRRFQEAEDDCTEALNLDDRYIKAYSRRSTARKELGKLKESIEDAEFALRLEPHNQEIKKQYAETKSLYEKEILNKASGALRSSVQKVGKSKVEVNEHVGAVQSVSRSLQKMVTAAIQEDHNKDTDGQVPAKTSMSIEEIENKSMRSKGQEANASCEDGVQSSGLESSKKNHKKQELKASVQELAARAASLAKAEAAKNITPPNSAYQFEVSWRGLAGDITSCSTTGFKNAMSAPMLVDIIRCIATFFTEEMDLAVKYLENLAKVSRFDTIMMCLSSTDRADLHRIWDDVFCNNATPMEYAERLDKLRSRYCLKQ